MKKCITSKQSISLILNVAYQTQVTHCIRKQNYSNRSYKSAAIFTVFEVVYLCVVKVVPVRT